MSKTKKIRSDVMRDSVNTFGTNAVISVLSLVQIFIQMRWINPAVKGDNTSFTNWGSGFLTVLSLSITSSVVYFIARYTMRNTRAALAKITGGVFALILVVSTAVLVLLRSRSLFEFQKMPVNFIVAIVVNALLCLVLNVFVGVLRGENKFKSFNIINLVQKIVMIVLVIYIACRPSTTVWIWGTNAIAAIAIGMAVYGMWRWNGPKPQPVPEDDHPVAAGGMVAYSLKSHVSNVLTYVNTYLGSYVVQGLYGNGNLAVYGVALTAGQQLCILPNAVSQVIMSRLAAMNKDGDRQRLTLTFSKIVTYLTVISAPLLYWACRLLIPWIFPKYAGSLGPLPYLICGQVFISFATVLNNSIAAYGRPELNIIPTVCGVVTNIVFDFLLIPKMGMNGIALATALSMTMQGVSSIVIFCRYTHTPFYRLIIPTKEEFAMAKGVFKK
jgi:O-antigen/teichoic acid export membrane protein